VEARTDEMWRAGARALRRAAGGGRGKWERKRMGANPGKAETEAEEGPGSESEEAEAGIGVRNLDSVVKVYALHNEPNWAQPWQRKRQEASTSSAFVVRTPSRTRALITNAHAVEFASMVKVRARGRDEKHVASVAGLAPDADLALLSVSSSDFWEDSMEPLELAGLPQLQSKILAVGFPIGGESLAVTSGVVSRVEVIPYQHGGQQLLAVQADSAINAGNSGGPAVDSEGRCRGVAFQSLKEESAQNIGYIIPTHVVEHFLVDVFENHAFYCYYPILGVELQCMESPHLRQAKKMEKGQKGVLLQRIEPTLPVASHLQKGDVLLSFDETPIGNDASIAFRNGERIHFSYLVSSKFHNETAKVDILRDGQMHSLDIPLSRPKRLVPSHMNDVSPKYFVVGSFVFTTLSAPYLRSCYGKDYELDSPVRLGAWQFLFVSADQPLSRSSAGLSCSRQAHAWHGAARGRRGCCAQPSLGR